MAESGYYYGVIVPVPAGGSGSAEFYPVSGAHTNVARLTARAPSSDDVKRGEPCVVRIVGGEVRLMYSWSGKSWVLVDREVKFSAGADPDPDRASEWDENQFADALVGGGGVCIWARHGRPGSCAVRGAEDPVKVAMTLAMVRVAEDKLYAALAQHHGISVETLRDMVRLAYDGLAPVTDHVARVKRAAAPEGA